MKIKQEIGNDGSEVENSWIEYDEEFSNKNFSNQFLTDMKLDGQTIYSSLFFHEIPDSKPFPKNMTGVTFINCDLSNVIVPPGNKVMSNCTVKRFEAQNDGNDWLIDEDNNPTLPLNHFIFTKLDLPMPKPEDIPEEKVEETIDLKKVAEELKANTIIE